MQKERRYSNSRVRNPRKKPSSSSLSFVDSFITRSQFVVIFFAKLIIIIVSNNKMKE